jgi:hypothetical protein
MVWFHCGKHDIEDATLERTSTRALTETTLRHLGTESSGHNKRYVYIARVQPGSIPNTTST